MDNFVPRHAAFIAIQIYLLECKLVFTPLSYTRSYHNATPSSGEAASLSQIIKKQVYDVRALQPIGVKNGTVGLKKSELQ